MNYFPYYSEVEEHFRAVRGTAGFLLSPADWARVQRWKEAGIPLAAVLRGIDAAFREWRGQREKTEAVNSLAYCERAVRSEAEAMRR